MRTVYKLLGIGALLAGAYSCSYKNSEIKAEESDVASVCTQVVNDGVSQVPAGFVKNEEKSKQKLEIRVHALNDYKGNFSTEPTEIHLSLQKYLSHGFDCKDDEIAVTYPEGFKYHILEIAGNLGYKKKDITKMSALETAQIACRIVESRFDHYANISSSLSSLSRLVSPYSGFLTSDIDSKPVDGAFIEGKKIVCRHYAKFSKAVYEALKSINQNSANAFLSCYSSRPDHLWNQLTMISKDNDSITLDIVFLDPTWEDAGASLDALDELHFGGEHDEEWKRHLSNLKTELSKDFDVEVKSKF